MWKFTSDERGAQRWIWDKEASHEYIEAVEAGREQWKREGQKHATDLPLRFAARKVEETAKATNAAEACKKGIRYFQALQCDDGHFAGDYGGPMFLLPGLVIACEVAKIPLGPHHTHEMLRYIRFHQNEDGGWGTHIEGPSTLFGSCLNYTAARLLGLEKDEEQAINARDFIHAHGGAVRIPSWGKFWLAVLNVYEWDGVNPLLPETWLLPRSIPIQPSNMWCHSRVVYLPMSYIYGKKHKAELSHITQSLREELYVTPYQSIDWVQQRGNIAPIDLYTRHSKFFDLGNKMLCLYERFHPKWLREKALREVLDHIKHEDVTTNWICIGPVNKVINMLCCYFEDPNSEHFKKHLPRIKDYLWFAEDGMKMQGYNGSQLWDTAFAGQALIESQMIEECKNTLLKLHSFVEHTQVPEDVDEKVKYYRHCSKGGWPFSTQDHGWPITDCTAEGLKVSIKLRHFPWISTPIDAGRLFDAVNVLLSMQNSDGGWGTYEPQRGPAWLELLNPSEVFGAIMVDYSYVECTSACVQALSLFHKDFPAHRTNEVGHAVHRGRQCIMRKQRSDGSWYGSWGVCFTYGTWFGVEGLATGNEASEHEAIQRACQFLVSKQKEDGSWGETYESCTTKRYVQATEGHVVNTAWAVLALMAGGYEKEPIRRGIEWLIANQESNGDWRQQTISGVFNANCTISYSNYRNIFPLWALGRFAAHFSSDSV